MPYYETQYLAAYDVPAINCSRCKKPIMEQNKIYQKYVVILEHHYHFLCPNCSEYILRTVDL